MRIAFNSRVHPLAEMVTWRAAGTPILLPPLRYSGSPFPTISRIGPPHRYQSHPKILTKPHTGKATPIQRHLKGSKPCVAKRHRFRGL